MPYVVTDRFSQVLMLEKPRIPPKSGNRSSITSIALVLEKTSESEIEET